MVMTFLLFSGRAGLLTSHETKILLQNIFLNFERGNIVLPQDSSLSPRKAEAFSQTFLAEEKVTFALRGDSANIWNPWYDVDYSVHSLHCVKIDNFWLH